MNPNRNDHNDGKDTRRIAQGSGIGRLQLFTNFPALSGIAGRSQDQLLAHTLHKHLEARQILAREGRECAYLPLVLRGTIRVYKTSEEGKELTLYRISPGESCILTATCILNHQNFPAKAVVEEAADLFLVPARLFSRLVDEDGQWRRFVFGLYSRRLEIVLSLLEEVAFRHMDSRLASYLVSRSKESTGPVEKTHIEIASELGTSREVITRILKDFEQDGLIQTRRGRIEVIQSAELEKRI